MWLGDPDAELTFVLTTDVAEYLAAAVDAPVGAAERIDIGWDRPLSMNEFARMASGIAGEPIRVRAIPRKVLTAVGAVVGRKAPMVPDMAAMAAWFDTGGYVARTDRQRELFGWVPTAEDAVRRLAEQLQAADRTETVWRPMGRTQLLTAVVVGVVALTALGAFERRIRRRTKR